MRRISDEDGREASSRNIGRLALAIIPAALGGAAVLWVLAASGYVDLNKHLRAERRALESVGLKAEPVTPIGFESHDAKCLKIDAASLRDGDHFVFYARNACATWLKSPSFSYRAMAADRTVVASSDYAFDGDRMLGPNERREQIVWLRDGTTRVETISINAID